jgi:pyrroline-5-carboxylate reductase
MNLESFQGRVAFIGAGNMGGALISGYLKAGLAPGQIAVFDSDTAKRATLEERGVRVEATLAAVARGADVVVLAVKPGLVTTVLGQCASEESGALWLSVAAGVTTEVIETSLTQGKTSRPRVVRAMPNTPALVLAGATAVAPGRYATESDLACAELLMGAVGSVVRVSEPLMDAVTALSGSGPAFVMLFIEALADAGVQAGLPRKAALTLAAETVRGSADLVLKTGQHPAELKDQVASPGGTTIAGLVALEQNGFRGAVIAGVRAAWARARELSGASTGK